MNESELFKSGRIMLAAEPVRGQSGIHVLYEKTRQLMQPLPGEEVWAVFYNFRRNRLKVLHIDITGVDLLTRRLNHGCFQLNAEFIKENEKLTRGDLKRLLFDGTLPGYSWSSALSEKYYLAHPEEGYFPNAAGAEG